MSRQSDGKFTRQKGLRKQEQVTVNARDGTEQAYIRNRLRPVNEALEEQSARQVDNQHTESDELLTYLFTAYSR
jgi:hypothetical protein